MGQNRAWETEWEYVKDLGEGGQGSALLVTRKSTFEEAVLKELKKQGNPQARRRMHQEVVNLRIMANAGARVPRVLQGNTDRFEEEDVELYFVMEYVVGEPLNETVSRKGELGVEAAIGIVKDLCMTLKIGVENQVCHRDIKPKNILVPAFCEPDAVIKPRAVMVDYGLSFNALDGEDLTRATETIDNSFLSLPERRVIGGNRRDHRSDITGVCGILYYCLTGQSPVDLRDAEDRPPHRRTGGSIREVLGKGSTTDRLESLLDRGFAPVLDHRFQTIEELIRQLDDILDPAARETGIDPISFARGLTERLTSLDRRTQLVELKKTAQQTMGAIRAMVQQYHNKLGHCQILGDFRKGDANEPADGDNLLIGPFWVGMNIQQHPHQCGFGYCIRARGLQIVVFRCDFRVTDGKERSTPVGDWVEILSCQGDQAPSLSVVEKDVEANLVRSMRALEEAVLGGPPA